MPEDTATLLRRVLQNCRTIAVVGLSADRQRPSHAVASYLQAHGYRIVPVNPRHDEILGEKCYPRLEEIPFAVDMVDVFRQAEHLPPIARSAVAIGARCLWQQIGVRSDEVDAIARAAGLDSVQDRCVEIEHARLLGGLHGAGADTGATTAQRPR
jgi:hypothetical protein